MAEFLEQTKGLPLAGVAFSCGLMTQEDLQSIGFTGDSARSNIELLIDHFEMKGYGVPQIDCGSLIDEGSVDELRLLLCFMKGNFRCFL